MPTALITGVTGQDGSYLARLLLLRGYHVIGAVRDVRMAQVSHTLAAFGIGQALSYVPMDLADAASIRAAVRDTQPDELYHLAAQTSIARSFDEPNETMQLTGFGTATMLEALREDSPATRFLFASSAGVFGLVNQSPQTEDTPINPRSPYAVAKAFGQFLSQTYRDAYGLHCSCAIMYNHESPLRQETFVSRKITLAVARIKHGMQKELLLGDLSIERDWGFAGDYVEAMPLMTAQEVPGDYVLSTGKIHSLRYFVDLAFGVAGLDPSQYVRVDSSLFRPVEQMALVGNPAKAERVLGWRAKVSFEEMVEMLVETDLARVRAQSLLLGPAAHQ